MKEQVKEFFEKNIKNFEKNRVGPPFGASPAIFFKIFGFFCFFILHFSFIFLYFSYIFHIFFLYSASQMDSELKLRSLHPALAQPLAADRTLWKFLMTTLPSFWVKAERQRMPTTTTTTTTTTTIKNIGKSYQKINQIRVISGPFEVI